MSKFRWMTAMVVAPLLLSGCGGTGNVQTVKSADYTEMPRNIAAVVEAQSLDSRFTSAFVDSAGRCGVKVIFKQPNLGQPVKVDNADSILIIHELGHQTTTRTRHGYPIGQPWTSMVRLQFALTDMKSKKLVWKAQADFNVSQFGESDPTQRWADDLSGMMMKDKIFGSCDFNRKSASGIPKTTS